MSTVNLTREALIEAAARKMLGRTATAAAPLVVDAVLEAVARHYEQMERSHPASDGPTVIYAYEVAQRIRSLLPSTEGDQTNE